jgi:acetolactate synthase-1/2/3 large subunit
MPAAPDTSVTAVPATGAHCVVEGLLRCGITTGFGIPSIHNIALYEGLRQTPAFRHWVVRHEQAAGYAADGFYRRSGRVAAVFASTGPGNLFTLVPLLESLQTNTPVLVIGTNIASSLQAKSGGGLHETPQQIDIFKPLTRFARRVAGPDEIPETMARAGAMLHGPSPGPAFIEIAHDFLLAPVNATFPGEGKAGSGIKPPAATEIDAANQLISGSQRPIILVGGGIRAHASAVQEMAERLQAPILSTTSGKGMIADDHPLALGCISRLGAVQEVLEQSDLLVSCGAKLTEFDTGRFSLRLPQNHLQIVDDPSYPGTRFTATVQLAGDIGGIVQALAGQAQSRAAWCDVSAIEAREKAQLEGLKNDAYACLALLRSVLKRDDILVNDQSILNYWASAFFPVLGQGTFLYPTGSGTLGYGLPAAIGAACAVQQSGSERKIVCISGDGGFQYTQHELATLAQYGLPVKILLVNDEAYGIIGFLQRSMFGQTHEVALKNPDFCRVAESYGIRAERVPNLERLQQRLPDWLESPGPALLEWRTELKAPWEAGAIQRPTGVLPKK